MILFYAANILKMKRKPQKIHNKLILTVAKEFILKKLPAFVSAYIDENEKKKEKNSEKKEDVGICYNTINQHLIQLKIQFLIINII